MAPSQSSSVAAAPASGAQDAEDDDMHITDEHESLLPDRPEGLTQHVDAVSSAVEGIVGHKPSHGETVVIAASSVARRTALVGAAPTPRESPSSLQKQTSTPYERSIK